MRTGPAYPYFPWAPLDRSRFFPQLVGSTFVDRTYQFAAPRPGVPQIRVDDRVLPAPALPLGGAGMLAGTLIAAATAVAWPVMARNAWRHRD